MPSGSAEPATADTLGQTPWTGLGDPTEARDRMLRDRDRVVDPVRGEAHGHSGLTGHHIETGRLDDRALGHGIGDGGQDGIRPDAWSEDTDSHDDTERGHLSSLRERGRHARAPTPRTG